MNKKALPASEGMLFVFWFEGAKGFWMKNTTLALRLIYLDKSFRILSQHSLIPLDESLVMSQESAMYALELAQGSSQIQKIEINPY